MTEAIGDAYAALAQASRETDDRRMDVIASLSGERIAYHNLQLAEIMLGAHEWNDFVLLREFRRWRRWPAAIGLATRTAIPQPGP